MNMPLITVIVPIYNVESYLPTCLKSIISQTYTNLDIILVDDGCTDGCGYIAEEYAKIDKRVNVIHKQNGGLSDARNVAIDIARGEYITFVDSDDYLDQNYIGVLYSLIEKYKTKVAIVNPIAVDEKGKLSHMFCHDNKEYNFDVDMAVEKMFYQEMFDTSAWGKLYHKTLFNSGIRYPQGLLHEDLPTTYRLLYKTDKIAFKSCELYFYLIRNNSIERQAFSSLKMESALKVFEMFDANKQLLKNVTKACDCRIVSFALHILIMMPYNCDKQRKIIERIKSKRWSVIKNYKARKVTRVACVISYLGFKNFKKIYNIINIKR